MSSLHCFLRWTPTSAFQSSLIHKEEGMIIVIIQKTNLSKISLLFRFEENQRNIEYIITSLCPIYYWE